MHPFIVSLLASLALALTFVSSAPEEGCRIEIFDADVMAEVSPANDMDDEGMVVAVLHSHKAPRILRSIFLRRITFVDDGKRILKPLYNHKIFKFRTIPRNVFCVFRE